MLALQVSESQQQAPYSYRTIAQRSRVMNRGSLEVFQAAPRLTQG